VATRKREAREAYVKTYLTKPQANAGLLGITAYVLDSPGEKVSGETLASLGVVGWNFDHTLFVQDTLEVDPALEELAQHKGYSFRDVCDSAGMANLEQKLDHFQTEHLHDDEEIRYFVGGSGYFDVRSAPPAEAWIRMECKAGDMIVLPAGIYHRFVPDDKLSFKVVRFFSGEPVWIPWNRKDESVAERPARLAYESTFLSKRKRQSM
jgi:1,2-dihydroxy-3-keto-5-methylthiopentene dioxygenase